MFRFSMAAVLAVVCAVPVLAQGTLMPLPPQSSTFSGSVRGYWFTAPTDFTIVGLRVPTDASTAGQSVELLRFTAPPPSYPTTTNAFTSLFRQINVAGTAVMPANIQVSQGDVIGVLGWRGTVNSYGSGTYSTMIDGHPVTLERMGMQFDLNVAPAHDVWTELGGSISRVEIYYEVGLTVTSPNPLPDGAEGQPYTTTILADHGVTPYTWDTNITNLPAWLTATQVGDDLELSGTPPLNGGAGSYQFTVSVVDDVQDTADKTFDLTVHPPPPELTATPGTLPLGNTQHGSAGTPASYNLTGQYL